MSSSRKATIAERMGLPGGKSVSACRCKAAFVLTLGVAGASIWATMAATCGSGGGAGTAYGSLPLVAVAGIFVLTGAALYAQVQSYCRRRASEAAAGQSELAQKYLDIAGVMLLALDENGEVTLVNQQGQKILGYREEELLGRNWFETCLPVECRSEVREIFRHLIRGEIETESTVESVIVTKWGRERLIAWRNTLLTDRSGCVVGVLSSGEDVTERRRAEESLRQSEQRYRLVAENAKDVIWTADLNMRWTYISPSVELLQGFTAEEAMKMRLDEILAPESARSVQETLLRSRNAQKNDPHFPSTGVTREVEALRKDGSRVWTEAKVSFMRGEDGRPIGLLGVVRDITERKRAEEELKRAKAVAESANRAKSEFLANMSHEIRTPMTAILGYADVLGDSCTGPEEVDALRTIRRNGKHLLEIINDILDISKIEAGKMAYQQIPFSPIKIVSDVVSMMKGRAEKGGLDLRVGYEGTVPNSITGDPTRLRQILINLVGNAIKFTQEGRVELIVGARRLENGRGLLRVTVRDTGIGMEEHEIERLFAPFSQGDPTNSRRYGGTGLGLAISRRLAESLGGGIRCTSVAGEGSTFVVTIDAGVLDDVSWLDAREIAAGQASLSEETPPPCTQRLACRILLAEDGPDNQRLISLILRKAGADVTVVADGRAALEIALPGGTAGGTEGDASTPRFDLILMDMEMPVLDGYGATRQLREAGYAGPIIALTAHAMAKDLERALQAGCDVWMRKPIDRDELVATIAGHVGSVDKAARVDGNAAGRRAGAEQVGSRRDLQEGEQK